MKILVINAGSSSVKFTCFDMNSDEKVLAHGLIERIGMSGTLLKYSNYKNNAFKNEVGVKDAKEAVSLIGQYLTDPTYGVLDSLKEIGAIGHRIVHGGEKITDPVVIDEGVKKIIEECFDIAPLHNPPNLAGIEACESVFPGVVNVGVFDTAFHSTIPPKSYLYGLPYQYYTDYKIRRYGFHGTSHSYVSKHAAEYFGMKLENTKIITCHLGNGCSIAAIDGGKCQDTSMGMTPLEGLIMGTRSGDIDPAIVLYLMEKLKIDHHQADNILNKQSGMLGLAGIGSSDLRDIEDAYMAGNQQCIMAMEAYTYRIKKYIGAYMTALGNLDILVFTAGVGENSDIVREMVCRNWEHLGFKLDLKKNEGRCTKTTVISADDSPIKIIVVPTDEEQEIAIQTKALLNI